MSEFHHKFEDKTSSVTPRKALVQGTLDIVAPRSPAQSFDSPAAPSSSSSVVSSRHSYAEDHHATPRRNRPPTHSMYEEPQPERPSTSLELSDDEGEPNGSVRPLNDASNVPRPQPLISSQSLDPTIPVMTVNGRPDEDEASPFSIPIRENAFVLSEEENQSSEKATTFKPPRTLKSSSGNNKAGISDSRTKNTSTTAPGVAKKKKKNPRFVESRYMSSDSRKLTSSFMSDSCVGTPLLNSTAIDGNASASINSDSFRSRRLTNELKSSSAETANKLKRESNKIKKTNTPRKEPSVMASRGSAAENSNSNSSQSAVAQKEAQDELDYLHTLYIQYKFQNMLAKNQEKRQKHQFEAEFSTVLDAYQQNEEKLIGLRKELMYWQQIHKLDGSITKQISALESLMKAMPGFADRFSSLATALDSTRHELPVRDVLLPAPEELQNWQKELASDVTKASNLLEENLTFSSASIESVENLVEVVEKLRELKSKYQQLFSVAKDVLIHAQKKFAEEASLRVHAHQQR